VDLSSERRSSGRRARASASAFRGGRPLVRDHERVDERDLAPLVEAGGVEEREPRRLPQLLRRGEGLTLARELDEGAGRVEARSDTGLPLVVGQLAELLEERDGRLPALHLRLGVEERGVEGRDGRSHVVLGLFPRGLAHGDPGARGRVPAGAGRQVDDGEGGGDPAVGEVERADDADPGERKGRSSRRRATGRPD